MYGAGPAECGVRPGRARAHAACPARRAQPESLSKLYLEELDALEKCLATAAAGVGGAHVLM